MGSGISSCSWHFQAVSRGVVDCTRVLQRASFQAGIGLGLRSIASAAAATAGTTIIARNLILYPIGCCGLLWHLLTGSQCASSSSSSGD